MCQYHSENLKKTLILQLTLRVLWKRLAMLSQSNCCIFKSTLKCNFYQTIRIYKAFPAAAGHVGLYNVFKFLFFIITITIACSCLIELYFCSLHTLSYTFTFVMSFIIMHFVIPCSYHRVVFCFACVTEISLIRCLVRIEPFLTGCLHFNFVSFRNRI